MLPNATFSIGVCIASLTLFWLVAIYQIGAQWSLYPQYSYGWAVPLLIGYFALRRWQKRPPPESASSTFLPRVLMVVLAAGFFFTRLIQEPNLIWRLPSWLMGFEVVGITLAAIYLAGGKSWLKHFAFPACFFFVAIPWLRPIEEPFIQGLARFNAKTTVEILSLLGIPVLQQGNVIETSRGLVGIDEACSGVRSFQATLMLSLLFGEYYFLNLKERWKLVMAGIALAVGANILRTATLVLVCTQKGLKTMEQWHDPTGVGILTICFLGLWAIARVFIPKTGAPHGHQFHASAETALRTFPKTLSIGLGVALVLAEVSTELWYRMHEHGSSHALAWTLKFPEDKSTFQKFEISKTARERLNFNEGAALGWADHAGHKWQMLYFSWDPARTRRGRILVQDGKNHVPEGCLTASGKKLITDAGVKKLTANSIVLPFRAYVFEDQGEPMHVYFCLWQDLAGSKETDYEKFLTQSPRLASVALGNRSSGVGLQILELAVWGIKDDQESQKAAERELRQWIQPKTPW